MLRFGPKYLSVDEPPVKADMAGLEMPDIMLHHFMETGKRVERHRRKAVMFGMIGHVPGQKPHRRRGQQGARIDQHVAAPFFAARMLRRQTGAQERRTDHKRRQHKGDEPAAGRKDRQQGCVNRRHPARLAHDRGALDLRRTGVPPAAGGVSKTRPHIPKPEGQAAQIPEITADARRLRRTELRVTVRVLGESVMILMETEEPFRTDKKDRSRQAAPSRAKPRRSDMAVRSRVCPADNRRSISRCVTAAAGILADLTVGDGDAPGGRVDGDMVARLDQPRDIAIGEAVAHRRSGEDGALRRDGVGGVQRNGARDDAAR